VNLGRPTVTNGDSVTQLCESDALFPNYFGRTCFDRRRILAGRRRFRDNGRGLKDTQWLTAAAAVVIARPAVMLGTLDAGRDAAWSAVSD